MPTINAPQYYDPAIVPGLIARAIKLTGSQKEAATRLGVTPRYLRMIVSGERNADYGMQVMLERMIDDAEG